MRMSLIAAAAVLSACGSAHAYVFGGITGPNGWQWTGAGMIGFRSAMENPANFGPGGVVAESIQTVVLGTPNAVSLAAIDCFVAPANLDSEYSAAAADAIRDWFLAGGDLLLMNDRFDYDRIGELLGVPTTSWTSGPLTANAVAGTLANGPFGNVTSFQQTGLVGGFTSESVASTGGVVDASNSQGVTLAHWAPGAFGPNSGRLVIVGDVDTFASNVGYGGMADFNAMNSNAILALNTAAYFVPAPGAVAMLGLGGLAMTRRRR